MEANNRFLPSADQRLAEVESFAVARHAGAPSSHDYSHVERVRDLALRIARAEGADVFIVECAALLHDTGRTTADSGYEDGHEEVSANLALPLLDRLGFPAGERDSIIHAIRAHRHRKGVTPETPEAKCVYDADKLDSLGAVGVARAYLWLGEHGRSVHYPESEWRDTDPEDNRAEVDSFQREWAIKFKFIPERLHTEEGRTIARDRHARMKRFLEELEAETRGHL